MLARLTPLRSSRLQALNLYLAVISAVGVALLAAVLLLGAHELVSELSLQFAVLATFVLLGELLTIKLPRHGDRISISTPFVFALMLVSGVPAAIIAQAVASLVGDIRDRRPALATMFNLSQQCLAVAAAGLVLMAISGLPHESGAPLRGTDLPQFWMAGAAFFVANNLLAGSASALLLRMPLTTVLRADLAFQLVITAVFLSLGPMIARTSNSDLVMIVMLVIPLLTIYRGGRDAVLSEHQALHDGLTGLPNRMFFLDRLKDQLSNMQRNGSTTAVMMVDLDHFKEINDWLGHHYGDLLLREIGPRLQMALDEGDTIARMGGDEFAIMLPQVSDTKDVEVVAQRLLDGLRQPFEIRGLSLTVGASVGITFSPRDGDDPDTLLHRADVAMFIAKEGGGGYESYSPERDYSPNRIALAGEIHGAAAEGHISLYYQPIVELRTRTLAGVEALARWHHPTRGLIGPTEFIPIAEQTGLIGAMTLGLLEVAMRDRKMLGPAGTDLPIAFNISPRQLLDLRFPEQLAVLLARHGVSATTVKLEITENVVMVDPDQVNEVLKRLNAMGIKLAIDDFGTGYSSLAHLTRLPVDEIKIDRSFVGNMSTNKSDAQIVRSTVALAHNLGLPVVAEGVETEENRDQLLALGCDYAQGYYMSRPLPPDKLRSWLTRRGQEYELAPAVLDELQPHSIG